MKDSGLAVGIGMNGGNVKLDWGWGLIEGRELTGLLQRVFPTPNELIELTEILVTIKVGSLFQYFTTRIDFI